MYPSSQVFHESYAILVPRACPDYIKMITKILFKEIKNPKYGQYLRLDNETVIVCRVRVELKTNEEDINLMKGMIFYYLMEK